MINKKTKELLEKHGYSIGDYGNFLNLTEDERDIIEAEIALAEAEEKGFVPFEKTKAELGLKDD